MNKPWKIAWVLLGIFLAGAVAGAFLTKRFAREWLVKRPAPEQWAPHHLKRLVENLQLPPEQVEQIRPIVRRNMTDLNRLHDNMVTESQVIMERMQREISEKLTPEQRERYEQMNREMRERLKKFNREKGMRPPGPGNPPPPSPLGPPPPAERL